MQSVTTACNGSFWKSTNERCSELLAKVDKVSGLSIQKLILVNLIYFRKIPKMISFWVNVTSETFFKIINQKQNTGLSKSKISSCLSLQWTLIFNFSFSVFVVYIQDVDALNIYDILEPCYHSTQAREIDTGNIRLPSSFRKLGETERPLAVRKRMFGRAWPFRAPVRDGIVPTWPQILNGENVPCTVSFSIEFPFLLSH